MILIGWMVVASMYSLAAWIVYAIVREGMKT